MIVAKCLHTKKNHKLQSENVNVYLMQQLIHFNLPTRNDRIIWPTIV